eukprot:g27819.t1
MEADAPSLSSPPPPPVKNAGARKRWLGLRAFFVDCHSKGWVEYWVEEGLEGFTRKGEFYNSIAGLKAEFSRVKQSLTDFRAKDVRRVRGRAEGLRT